MDTTTGTQEKVRYFASMDELSYEAFRIVRDEARKTIEETGLFTLSLSGGSSPRGLYRRLAQPGLMEDFEWDRVHLFWGDERCVPPEHKENNFRMAAEDFIYHVPIPHENIHRIITENRTPEDAASLYEMQMREYFTCRPRTVFPTVLEGVESCFPRFDVLLLGVGRDGHIASLFPDSPGLGETSRWVISTPPPSVEPKVPRISITMPVIEAAGVIMVIVTGEGKREIIRDIFDRPEEARRRYPAAGINALQNVYWFLDEQYR